MHDGIVLAGDAIFPAAMSLLRSAKTVSILARQCARVAAVSQLQQRNYAEMAFTFVSPAQVKLYKKIVLVLYYRPYVDGTQFVEFVLFWLI